MHLDRDAGLRSGHWRGKAAAIYQTKKLKDSNDELATVQAALASVNANLAAADKAKAAAQDDLERLEKRLKTKDNDLTKARKQWQAAQSELDEAVRAKRKAEREAAEQPAALADLTTKKDGALAEAAAAKAEVDALKKESADLKKQLDSKMAEVTSSAAPLSTLKVQLQKAEEASKKYENEAKAEAAKAKSAEASAKEAESKCDAFAKELADAQKALSEAGAAAEKAKFFEKDDPTAELKAQLEEQLQTAYRGCVACVSRAEAEEEALGKAWATFEAEIDRIVRRSRSSSSRPRRRSVSSTVSWSRASACGDGRKEQGRSCEGKGGSNDEGRKFAL